MKAISFYISILFLSLGACSQERVQQIDLAGTWRFQIDSLDQGSTEQWFLKSLPETVQLPGSMVENNKGNEISVHTQWTGNIIDQSWFTEEKYARYREPGNVKIPFWLQAQKHYQGAAWYQREVDIPADWEGQLMELFLERAHWETRIWVDEQALGMQNRLGTAHVYHLPETLKPGVHTITIRVDNRVKEIDPGQNSHSISDHTQTNWNGIVGRMSLSVRPAVYIEKVKLYPDIEQRQVLVKVQLQNLTGALPSVRLTLQAQSTNGSEQQILKELTTKVEVGQENWVEVIYPMGDSILLWDEFEPNLYTMRVSLESEAGTDQRQVNFGMREFATKDTRFTINDRPVFLRGTLECAIFPRTGYPATDLEEWKRIFRVVKAHGLNHVRFHSWCPPEAAFDAADQLGVYLQIECSSWANQGTTIGDGRPVDQWIYDEAAQILDDYGNHPSFCLMAYGNEPAGQNQAAYLSTFIDHWRSQDARRVYTGGAGWPFLEDADYRNEPAARIQGWGQELNSIINREPPQTTFDFREIIRESSLPYVSHEIGQWCVYPNFKEMDKYTGVLRPKNFEIFQESLEAHHLGHLADSFLLASGKLQALCYKADIEAALRTPGMAGFQLLDLHDFPGQGTALVGVLDPFWEEKGYISPEEYSQFCNQTVPLVRLAKRIFSDNESLTAEVEVAHFGKEKLISITPTWKLTNQAGETVATGALPARDIPLDNTVRLGKLNIPLPKLTGAQQLTLSVEVAGFTNRWPIWIFPSEKEALGDASQLRIVSQMDNKTLRFLRNGGKVLLSPPVGSVKPDKGGDVGIGFSSIFWNTAWTHGQKPHTLGILCDPAHPALAEFPTEYHSNWQWWDAMSHSNAILLDEFTTDLKPIVRVIDDWFTNRSLGLIFEAKVGQGKLIISGIDLMSDQENRPEAQQLLYSLQKYMLSDQFAPQVELQEEQVLGLFSDK